MKQRKTLKEYTVIWAAMISLTTLAGCSGHSGQMAGEGATMGAVAGMVGGLVTGLVFGGNPGELAAQGAVWGASSGAVSGAMAGAKIDQAERTARQKAELERIRAKLGDDAFSGLKALAKCKHEVSLGYARTAAKSDNKAYALAGLWLEVLTHGDRREMDLAQAQFSVLIDRDDKIDSQAQALEKLNKALTRLREIRGEYNLPKTCNKT